MAQFSDPKELQAARVHMWLDQIIKNLESIEEKLNDKKYSSVHEELAEQYRLIQVLRSAKQGKTLLQGWKTITSK